MVASGLSVMVLMSGAIPLERSLESSWRHSLPVVSSVVNKDPQGQGLDRQGQGQQHRVKLEMPAETLGMFSQLLTTTARRQLISKL